MKLYQWGIAIVWSAVWCLYYVSGEGYYPVETGLTTLHIICLWLFCAGMPFLPRAAGIPWRRLLHDFLPYFVLPFIGSVVDCLNYNYDYAFCRYNLLSLCFWTGWSLFWGMLDFRSGDRRAARALCRSIAFLPVIAALFFKFELTLRFLRRQLDSLDALPPVLLYLSAPLLKLLLGAGIAFAAFYCFGPDAQKPEACGRRRKHLNRALPATLLFTLFIFVTGPAWKALEENSREDEQLLRYAEKRRVLPPGQLTGPVRTRDREPGIFFLFIGERQSAEPYLKLAAERPLFLSELLKSDRWINHPQAFTHCPSEQEKFYSDQVVTDYAVSMMLTPLDAAVPREKLYEVPTLFDFARTGEYGTRFCSSQLAMRGLLLNIALLADSADKAAWPKVSSPARQLNMAIDREAVRQLREWREAGELSGRQLVVVKLMGNHEGNITPPPELAKANPGLDEYELSLLFFDETLRQLVAEAEACPDTAAILYLPDHGKNYLTEEKIPFLIHLSDRFRQRNPELEHELRENAEKPFKSADLFSLMLKLLGVTPAR